MTEPSGVAVFPFPLLVEVDGSSVSDSVSELVSGLVMGKITAGGRGLHIGKGVSTLSTTWIWKRHKNIQAE